uniref:Uncharacterized protein n=1 Tax=viral metagenome TaxID=1070528 RepID=A0A6C0ETY1_9ZZZZ
MTSNSGVSSGSTSRAIHGIVASSSTGALYSYSVILYKYQLLYNNVMSQLLPYMEYFSKADYDILTSKFTRIEYNRIVLQSNINHYNTDTLINSYDNFISDNDYNDTQFNNYVTATFLILDSLWASVPFQKNFINLKFENDELQTYKKILEDPVLLQDYINKRNIHILPFQATSTFNTQIILKPWFAVYLQRYGAPADGYFHTEYLASIVIELIANGTITEEEFLQG